MEAFYVNIENHSLNRSSLSLWRGRFSFAVEIPFHDGRTDVVNKSQMSNYLRVHKFLERSISSSK